METSWFQWKGFDVDEEKTLARTEVAIPREGRPEKAAEIEDEPARIGPYALGEIRGAGPREPRHRRRVLGPEHPRTLDSQFTLAEVLDAVGRPDEAIALLRATHAAQARHPSD